jgi:outer membrane receptor protein involved in Fe transport
VRGNFFYAYVDDAIASVTVGITPSVIIRQRQNAGDIRSRGFEIDANSSAGPVQFTGSYQFADSVVAAFPTNINESSLRTPQVPRHQLSLQAKIAVRKWDLAIQIRASSEQFDDDLNQFRLESYFQADAFFSRRINKHLTFFAAAENLFNTRYSIGRTPLRTVNSPVGIRVGIRLTN